MLKKLKLSRVGWYKLLPVYIVLTIGCKKHLNVVEGSKTEPPEKIQEIKKYIPVTFEYDKQVTTLKYVDNTALLSEIENADGRKEVFSYNTAKQVIKYERFQNEQLEYLVDFLRNKDGMVIKGNRFSVIQKNYTPIDYYTLTYNTQNQLISVKQFDKNNKLKNDNIHVYHASGELLTKTTITEKTPDQLVNLFYDSKNGMFKYLSNVQLLSLEVQNIYLTSSKNNLIMISGSSSAQPNLRFDYEYNSDNYPEKFTLTEGGTKKNFTVTYKAID